MPRRAPAGLVAGRRGLRAAPSAVHLLDARTKLLAAVVYAVAVVGSAWGGQAVLAGYVGAAALLARVSARPFGRAMRPVLWVVLATVAANACAAAGSPLLRLGPLQVTRSGLAAGGLMGARLLLLAAGGALLMLTTKPVDMTAAVEWVLRPFRRLGVPAHEVALMMTVALRFIPTLLVEAERIVRAQQARGAVFDTGSLLRRGRALASVVVPLFAAALRHADDLATAMEARCYRGAAGRTRHRPPALHWRDAVAGAGTLGLLAAVGWLRWRGM